MQQSPFYEKFHNIHRNTKNKLSEVFMEVGSYAWGGYSAILIIETPYEVNLYSHLLRKDNFKYCESTISKISFSNFFDELIEKGVWKLDNNSNSNFDDGATFFLEITKGEKKKQITVYAPEFNEDTKNHFEIIKTIQEFCTNQEFCDNAN